MIEEGVGGKKNKAREIECAVLGNDEPKASVAGEIVPCKEFYDYEAKYLAEGSELVIPAKLTKAEMKNVQELAIAAFQAVDCSGLARVDFLMDPKSRKIYVNEINTMPGFTAISMYPKLWGATGVSYPELIDRLIQLGMSATRIRSGINTAAESPRDSCPSLLPPQDGARNLTCWDKFAGLRNATTGATAPADRVHFQALKGRPSTERSHS